MDLGKSREGNVKFFISLSLKNGFKILLINFDNNDIVVI